MRFQKGELHWLIFDNEWWNKRTKGRMKLRVNCILNYTEEKVDWCCMLSLLAATYQQGRYILSLSCLREIGEKGLEKEREKIEKRSKGFKCKLKKKYFFIWRWFRGGKKTKKLWAKRLSKFLLFKRFLSLQGLPYSLERHFVAALKVNYQKTLPEVLLKGNVP